MSGDWWLPIRELNDRHFEGPAPGVDWKSHVQRLNADYGLSGDHALSTLPNPSLPPTWFIGDITTVPQGEWILILSLNPAADPDVVYYSKEWNADMFWDFQTRWFKQVDQWWNRFFHGPLSRLAMLATGRASDAGDSSRQKDFAASHLVFAELCPYSSRRFAVPFDALALMAQEDIGFQVEAQIVDIMVTAGRPALVLVNGAAAVQTFQAIRSKELSWQEVAYQSNSKAGKKLWHKEGRLELSGRSVPVAGFPFLRKPATHNSLIEIEQLGGYVRELLVR